MLGHSSDPPSTGYSTAIYSMLPLLRNLGRVALGSFGPQHERYLNTSKTPRCVRSTIEGRSPEVRLSSRNILPQCWCSDGFFGSGLTFSATCAEGARYHLWVAYARASQHNNNGTRAITTTSPIVVVLWGRVCAADLASARTTLQSTTPPARS